MNPKVHNHIHKCPPTVPILIKLYQVHTPTSHFLKIHLNIILPSTPGSPKWFPSFMFPHQNPVYASPLPHTRYMPRLSHSSRFYQPKYIGEEYRWHGASSVCGWTNGLEYGGGVWIYLISSRGQPIRSGPTACGVGEVITPRRKNVSCCETVTDWASSIKSYF